MGKLTTRILKEFISPGPHLIIYFVILISALCVGFTSAYFFKGNKNAEIIENFAEKIIESETGVLVDFDDSSDDEAPNNIPIHEFVYPSYQMDFRRDKQPAPCVKN